MNVTELKKLDQFLRAMPEAGATLECLLDFAEKYGGLSPNEQAALLDLVRVLIPPKRAPESV